MPLYSQIKQIILNDIKNGVYRLNETIPTEKQLQEIFGVSRMTIRLAIDALVAEGYVVKERSKGTRVIYPKITESLNEVTNFSQEMRNKGIQYNIHSVEVTIVKAGEDIANALQIEEGVNVLRLHRVYYVNQEPLCSITSYLPAALNLSVDENVYRSIIERFKGGPVGLEALASSIGEETMTLEDVYEPYLLQIGFINRTPRGRVVTEKAYRHLGYDLREGLFLHTD